MPVPSARCPAVIPTERQLLSIIVSSGSGPSRSCFCYHERVARLRARGQGLRLRTQSPAARVLTGEPCAVPPRAHFTPSTSGMNNLRLHELKRPRRPRSLRESGPWSGPERGFSDFKTIIPLRRTSPVLGSGHSARGAEKDARNACEGSLTCAPAAPGGPGRPLDPASPCSSDKRKKNTGVRVRSPWPEPPASRRPDTPTHRFPTGNYCPPPPTPFPPPSG